VDDRPSAPRAELALDDAGVVREADAAAADLLGCRVRDLIGKPFVVFVDTPLRRALFVALNDARNRGGGGRLQGGLLSRDPVELRATTCLAARRGGVAVTISDVERRVDTDRLLDRLRGVRERERALAGRLDAVTRPWPAALPDLDVGAAPTMTAPAYTRGSVLHDWRLVPSGELMMLVAAAHGTGLVHDELLRAIRESIRALVLAGSPVNELFPRVERRCGLRGVGPIASAAVAYGSPDGNRALVLGLGRASIWVRREDGSVARVATPGPALGSATGMSWSAVDVRLAVGDQLVLHADGGADDEAFTGAAELERRIAAARVRKPAGAAMARQLIEPSQPIGTTVVLCAIRAGGDPGSPTGQVRVRLGRDELRDIARSRERLTAWLERRAVRAETIERAVIVISELVTNAVSAASDRAELRVTVSRGAVLIEVSDDGVSWHPEDGLSPTSGGGHGLRVASALSEDLHVASSGAGTVIRARIGAVSMR
jgi:anti-sigma regulatory factor (Ser/Thr protein kinase)